MPRQRDSFGKTAVYRAQVKTCALARQLGNIDWTLIRVVRAHRTFAAWQVRKATADAVRALRRAGGAFPSAPAGGVGTAMPAWLPQ